MFRLQGKRARVSAKYERGPPDRRREMTCRYSRSQRYVKVGILGRLLEMVRAVLHRENQYCTVLVCWTVDMRLIGDKRYGKTAVVPYQ